MQEHAVETTKNQYGFRTKLTTYAIYDS